MRINGKAVHEEVDIGDIAEAIALDVLANGRLDNQFECLHHMKEAGIVAETTAENILLRGLLRWVEVYRDVLRSGSTALPQGKKSTPIDYEAVANVSTAIGAVSYYPKILEEIYSRPFSRIASLGAGEGNVIILALKENPNADGVAIERTQSVCEKIKQAAQVAGVGERLDVVCMNIADLRHDPKCLKKADIVEVGFALHDVLHEIGDAGLVQLLSVIRENLGQNGRAVIAEAVHATKDSHWFSRIFTLVHLIQSITLPTEEKWQALFLEAGFHLTSTKPGGMPGSRIFALSSMCELGATPTVPIYEKVEGHYGPVPFYLSDAVIPNAPIRLAIVDLGQVPSNGLATEHVHESMELYILPEYAEPVEIEVLINNQSAYFRSPCLVPIPAGVPHKFRVINALPGQFILGIFPKTEKEAEL